MAPDHPLWIRVLLRAASRRAAPEELGDVVEEYGAGGRSTFWLVSQVLSSVWRRRSHSTVPERGAEMLANVRNDIRYALRTLRRNPGLAAGAIGPIALGIGISINTGVYLYLPAKEGTQRSISVLARTRGEFSAFAAAVRAETSRLDASLVVHVQPLSDNLGLLQTLSRITAGIAGTLSLLAVSLASIGVYGVVSYVVSRRLREVVQIALGAGPRDVQRLILRQTLRPVAVGLAIGVAGAAAFVRLLQSVLFGASAYDPGAFIGAPLLMLAIAAVAAFMPTRRAMRVNPICAALRVDGGRF